MNGLPVLRFSMRVCKPQGQPRELARWFFCFQMTRRVWCPLASHLCGTGVDLNQILWRREGNRQAVSLKLLLQLVIRALPWLGMMAPARLSWASSAGAGSLQGRSKTLRHGGLCACLLFAPPRAVSFLSPRNTKKTGEGRRWPRGSSVHNSLSAASAQLHNSFPVMSCSTWVCWPCAGCGHVSPGSLVGAGTGLWASGFGPNSPHHAAGSWASLWWEHSWRRKLLQMEEAQVAPGESRVPGSG